jgi:hypothetical protein
MTSPQGAFRSRRGMNDTYKPNLTQPYVTIPYIANLNSQNLT